jgi:hypothetical protein
MANRIDGPITFTGQANFTGTMNVPAGTVTNAGIGASAASPIDTEKVEQQVNRHYFKAGSAASETVPIHVARADGTVTFINAGSVAIAVGASCTVTIDLKKNGSTVLTSVITLDQNNTARVTEPGTINTADYSEDDWFELVIVATAGGGTLPTGLYVDVGFREPAE